MNTDRGPLDQVSFDEQAAGVFETRAGFPDGVAEQIADAVREYARLGPDDLVLEIGAGTGLIGQWLARPPARYLGVDSSQPMLDVFRARLPRGGNATIRHADANQRWPVADSSARAIFGSRVFQLLDREHLVREANRVAHTDGAVLVQGTIKRNRNSPKEVLRRKLHERLVARGLKPRPAGHLLRQILERAAKTGGTILPSHTVATWRREVRPSDVLNEWREKYSMGGITPRPDVSAAILADLTAWVAEKYGEPTEPVMAEERYILTGVQLRSAKE